jgi:HPt (histidine-containing phosphotransfer) domain-containing protein
MIVSQDLKDPVDLDFLRNITDCDVEFEQDLLKTFIESSGNDVRKMEESIGNPHSNDWYLSSHSFKGSSASIGAFSLAKMLGEAQSQKDATDEDKIKILKNIKETLDNVIQFLSKSLV